MPQSVSRHHHPPPEIRAIMADYFQVEDMHDLDLFRKLYGVIHLIGSLKGDNHKDGRLSASRMRILVRLAIEHRLGFTEGLQPSELSEFLNVSRNTVSALLKGLEEQDLVERHLHPTDHRQFLIRITPTGEQLVKAQAPKFAAFVTDLTSILSQEERHTLSLLLDKLLAGMAERAERLGIVEHCAEAKVVPDQE